MGISWLLCDQLPVLDLMLREIMCVQEVQFEQNKCAASLALDKARPMRHEYIT